MIIKVLTSGLVFAALATGIKHFQLLETLVAGLSTTLILVLISWQLGARLARELIIKRLPRTDGKGKIVLITGKAS